MGGRAGGEVAQGLHLERGLRNSYSNFFYLFFSPLGDSRRRSGPTKREALECAVVAESAGPHKAQGALGSVRPQKV